MDIGVKKIKIMFLMYSGVEFFFVNFGVLIDVN